jgi:hypothetical protein
VQQLGCPSLAKEGAATAVVDSNAMVAKLVKDMAVLLIRSEKR